MIEEREETVYDDMNALRKERQAEGRDRVTVGKMDYPHAKEFCRRYGITLQQHTDVHYSLRSPSGWILNIYPGNQRLFRDGNRQIKAPFLKLSDDVPWTLGDVVRAAVESLSRKGRVDE